VSALEDKLRRLEYQYRAKSDELDAVLRRLSSKETGSDGGVLSRYDHAESVSSLAEDETQYAGIIAGADTGDMITGVATGSKGLRRNARSSSASAMNLPTSLSLDLAGARLAAAEGELLSLNDALTSERHVTTDLKDRIRVLEAQLLAALKRPSTIAVPEDSASEVR
jgi:hypothetical protein